MSFLPDPRCISLLQGGEVTFLLQKDGITVREAAGRGIGPALSAFDAGILKDAVVYDTIIGKAAAALFCLGKAKCVYGDTMSDAAVFLLEEHNIPCCRRIACKQIINRRGDGLCPFEQAVLACDTPEDCLPLIRQTMKELKK